MGKIFVGQTALTITATVKQDVSGATCLIKYKKPSGTTGSFPASIITPTSGVIRYTVLLASDLSEEGKWVFWAYVTFADGTVAAGEPYTRKIYTEGK